MSFTIRRYRPADGERVAELTEAALRDAGAYSEAAPVHGDPAAYLDGERAAFLVGATGGEVVATGAFRPPADPLTAFGDPGEAAAELKRMHVHPDYQRRGYAARLLEELVTQARGDGYEELVLVTTAAQESALAFYADRGFAETGREQVELGEESFELVLFRRAL